MSAKREIKQVLVKVRGRDGAAYAVAHCADDSYAILRNGEMLEQCWSTDGDLEDCINTMMEHAGVGKTDIKPITSSNPTSQPN